MSLHKQLWTIICKNLEFNSKLLTIIEHEHHYMYHVLRLKEGEVVNITNCQGLKANGIILTANKKEILIEVEKICLAEKLKPEINLWIAMPKPTTLNEVIANSSEMGVSNIHIFKSEKSISKAQLKIEKLQQLSDESTRVSKSAYAAKIHNYESLENFYSQHILKTKSIKLVFFCDESHVYENKIQNSIFREIQRCFNHDVQEICVLIGPEASFTAKEREFIQNNINCVSVSLGNNILRVPNAVLSSIGVAINFRDNLNFTI